MNKYIIISNNSNEKVSDDFLDGFKKDALYFFMPTKNDKSYIEKKNGLFFFYYIGEFDFKLLEDFVDDSSIFISINHEFLIEKLITFASKYKNVYTAYDHFSDLSILFNKHRMRVFLEENNIFSPSLISSYAQLIPSKLYVVKPNLSSGSENIKFLLGKNITREIFQENNCHIEEFFSGDTFHFDLAVQNQSLYILGLGKYRVPSYRFYNGMDMSSFISFGHYEFDVIEQYVRSIFAKLSDIPNGFYHIEIGIENDSGLPFLIEINPRTPGAKIHLAYSMFYGVNIRELHFQLQLSRSLDLEKSLSSNSINAVTGYYPPFNGTITQLNYFPHFSSYLSFYEQHFFQIGEVLQPPSHFSDRAYAIAILTNSYSSAEKCFHFFSKFRPYEYTS